MDEDIITRIFCDIDDFCVALEKYVKARLLPNEQAGAWFPESRMALSEIIAILSPYCSISSGYRCFKWYYNRQVVKHLKAYFPGLVSDNQFVELIGADLMPLALCTQKFWVGTVTGISFIGSTPTKACIAGAYSYRMLNEERGEPQKKLH